MIRIAHCTDVHWTERPSFLESVKSKRIFGAMNVVFGRGARFGRDVQQALVDAMAAQRPDAVVVTGDLTSTAMPQEFAVAKAALEPLLSTHPSMVTPGNHDLYTIGAERSRRVNRFFEPWMRIGPDGIGRLDVGDATILSLDPNRARVESSGFVPRVQLDALLAALASLAGRHVVLALHYPLFDRHGSPYDGWNHGLRNAREVIAALESAPIRPKLVLHGHVHHGYRIDHPVPGGTMITCDPGSGGYRYDPAHHRAAAFNVYTIGDEIGVERFLWNGTAFLPETPGPYQSGF